MKKRIGIILAIVVIAALMGWRLAGNKKAIDAKKVVPNTAHIAIPVNVQAAEFTDVEARLMRTGTLIPNQEADIAATTSGNLSSVNIRLGSVVRAGSVVASIDTRMLQLRLESARLQQKKLQDDYQRYSVLLEGEATTESNLKDIRYNLAQAGNQISQISRQIADNQIKSPISGQVVVKNVEAGEFVNPGTVLAKIVDVSRLKVDVLVSEAEAYQLKTGQQVQVKTELYPGQQFAGRISFISQQGDAAHNYQVQVELPNPAAYPLKAGSFVYVDFIQNSSQKVLQIPRSALVESLKNPYVYVVEQGKAVRRNITPGRELGARIEVLDGLKAGELVIVNGQINLSAGTAVAIVQPSGK